MGSKQPLLHKTAHPASRDIAWLFQERLSLVGLMGMPRPARMAYLKRSTRSSAHNRRPCGRLKSIISAVRLTSPGLVLLISYDTWSDVNLLGMFGQHRDQVVQFNPITHFKLLTLYNLYM